MNSNPGYRCIDCKSLIKQALSHSRYQSFGKADDFRICSVREVWEREIRDERFGMRGLEWEVWNGRFGE